MILAARFSSRSPVSWLRLFMLIANVLPGTPSFNSLSTDHLVYKRLFLVPSDQRNLRAPLLVTVAHELNNAVRIGARQALLCVLRAVEAYKALRVSLQQSQSRCFAVL